MQPRRPSVSPTHCPTTLDRVVKTTLYLWRRSILLLACFSGGCPQSWQCTALKECRVSVLFVYGRAKYFLFRFLVRVPVFLVGSKDGSAIEEMQFNGK